MKPYFLLLVIIISSIELHAQKWVKVWADEFNTPGLPDTNKWNYEVGMIRNNELQYYTKRSQNARIEDTTLIIEARKESYNGAKYTSASLHTKYKGDWQYGKIEVRAKIPTGNGTFPGIWMLPTDEEYGFWPNSGEIDIMENVGCYPDSIKTTVIFEGPGAQCWTNTNGAKFCYQEKWTPFAAPYNKFYSYILEWTPDSLNYYVDTTKVFTYLRNGSTNFGSWPFNKHFYLDIDLAIGSAMALAKGLDTTLFPHQLIIDYVRVYQWQDTPGPYTVTIKPAEGGSAVIDNPMSTYPDGTIIKITAKADSNYYFRYWYNMGQINPLQFTVFENTTIQPVFYRYGEMILNGNFSEGLRDWSNIYLYDTTNDKATQSIVNDEYVCNITQKANDWWQIGTEQGPITLTNNVTYQISFDAYCQSPAQMGLTLSKRYGDYSAYYTNLFTITTTKTHYTWNVTTANPTDTNCRLTFGVGNFLGNVYLDNISMIKINPTEINELKKNESNLNIYPIPANQYLNTDFNLACHTNVDFSIYNIEGKCIQVLYNQMTDAGAYHLNFKLDKNNFIPGIYFLQMKTDDFTTTKKVVVQ